MWSLLSDYWGLTAPRLVISVTGGAKALKLKPRLRDSFKRGLVKAAASTGILMQNHHLHECINLK